MDVDTLFSIGELAKLCNVTPKTIRFYDKLGLLKPAMVNEQNGYRFYTHRHITRVTAIKQLQDIGVKLDEISSFFNQAETANSMDCLSDLLKIQENTVKEQLLTLSERLNSIRSLQFQCKKINEKNNYDATDGIFIRSIPERKVIYTSYQGEYHPALFRKSYQEILSLIKSAGYHINKLELSSPLAIFEIPDNRNETDKVSIKFGYETDSSHNLPFPSLLLPETFYACYIVKGPYPSIHSKLYRTLFQKIKEKGFQTLSPQIEYYYIHEAVANTQEQYLSEIQIPIKINEKKQDKK